MRKTPKPFGLGVRLAAYGNGNGVQHLSVAGEFDIALSGCRDFHGEGGAQFQVATELNGEVAGVVRFAFHHQSLGGTHLSQLQRVLNGSAVGGEAVVFSKWLWYNENIDYYFDCVGEYHVQ
jgi:hypothetical protein